MWSWQRPYAEVVEADLGLPVVHAQVLVPRAGQRRRVVPGQEGLTVDLPVDGPAAPGDGPVVAAPGDDAHVAPLDLAAVVVLVVATDHAERVVPAPEDEHVAGRHVGALVGVERLP